MNIVHYSIDRIPEIESCGSRAGRVSALVFGALFFALISGCGEGSDEDTEVTATPPIESQPVAVTESQPVTSATADPVDTVGSSGGGQGAIGDLVWQDLNGDGIQGAEEPGFADVEVRLLDCNGSQLDTMTTDGTGAYLFDELAAGDYRIEFVVPLGYELSPDRTTSAGQDSTPDPDTGLSDCMSLADAQSRLGVDAGLIAIDAPPMPGNARNVLLIMVDDLRPEAGAYGTFAINTPSIDTLAQQGVMFTRAYSQMSTCSPSRTSLLTGLRPDSTGVTDLNTHFRDTIPSVVTLPEYFKQHGYHSEGICKVYHNQLDDPQSWSVAHQDASGPGAPTGPDGKMLPFAAVDKSDSQFADYKCADLAIESLRSVGDSPFFIAVGFKKPHLPFLAPPAYFSMYDANAIPLASNPTRAADAPSFAFEDWGELSRYSGIPPAGQSFDESLRRELKHGYYAATSFVDAQIGRVLAELDRSGLSDNTVVVLVADHGFHLGEQDDWGKHTNFDVGTRVPLIIRTPDPTQSYTTDALVELVDLYPTIVELAGLPVPDAGQHGGYPLEGDSLVEFIEGTSTESLRGAFSQWRRGGYTGHSIRTERYRFTRWIKSGSQVLELYDHALDPDETTNAASQSEYVEVVSLLQDALDAGGQSDLPPQLR